MCHATFLIGKWVFTVVVLAWHSLHYSVFSIILSISLFHHMSDKCSLLQALGISILRCFGKENQWLVYMLHYERSYSFTRIPLKPFVMNLTNVLACKSAMSSLNSVIDFFCFPHALRKSKLIRLKSWDFMAVLKNENLLDKGSSINTCGVFFLCTLWRVNLWLGIYRHF